MLKSHKGIGDNYFGTRSRTSGMFGLGGITIDNSPTISLLSISATYVIMKMIHNTLLYAKREDNKVFDRVSTFLK